MILLITVNFLRLFLMLTIQMMSSVYSFRPLQGFGQRNVYEVDSFNESRSHVILNIIEANEKDSFNDNLSNTYFENIKMYFDLYSRDLKYKDGKVCKSSLTVQDVADSKSCYRKLKENLDKNCSYVVGNLVIAYIKDEDILFLNSIREVSGYVFIFANSVNTISLNQLEVIRGENPYIKDKMKISLIVINNYNGNEQLQFINMPKLQVILRHHILFMKNPGLCYGPNTINWESLTHYPQKIVWMDVTNCTYTFSRTIKCHESCQPDKYGHRFCWTDKKDGCQLMNDCRKKNCISESRSEDALYTPKCYLDSTQNYREECCHDQCAGGCNGPLSRDCITCRNFNNNGSCVEYCPSLLKFDQLQYVYNPNGRYSYHNMCVKECPEKFFKENGHCVAKCSRKNSQIVNKTCLPCPVNGCPKICFSRDIVTNNKVNFLHREMLNKLENCTIYDDNIIINQLSFTGDEFFNMDQETYGIRFEDLKKLEKLTEIYGSLYIQTYDSAKWFRSLSFLRNLRIIRGGLLVSRDTRGLYIRGNKYLLFLGLVSLKEVREGNVVIIKNENLCLVNQSNYRHILKASSSKYFVRWNGESCQYQIHCDRTCTTEHGCWGFGNKMCVKCAKYTLSDKHECTDSCTSQIGYYLPPKNITRSNNRSMVCHKCHDECMNSINTCYGPSSRQCNNGCLHFMYNSECVAKCRHRQYHDINNQCHNCHSSCAGNSLNDRICQGPTNIVGKYGCTRCQKVDFVSSYNEKNTSFVFSNTSNVQMRCLKQEEDCNKGTFLQLISSPSSLDSQMLPSYIVTSSASHDTSIMHHIATIRKWMMTGISQIQICLPCNPLCVTCLNSFTGSCNQCKHFKSQGQCVDICAPNEYVATITSNVSLPESQSSVNYPERVCLSCHEECEGSCTGPLPTECSTCKRVKIYLNQSENYFICNSSCGPDLVEVFQNPDIVCLKQYWSFFHFNKTNTWIIGSVGCLTTLCVLLCFISLFRKNYKRKRSQKIKYLDEFYKPEQHNGSDGVPNMAKLLLVTESEISRGEVIGSGAFGKVYKGYWKPNIEKLVESNSGIRNQFNKVANLIGKQEEIKILVAVKLLNDISDPSNNKELLEEAKVMASVDHTCCLRVLAVCLTAQPQLVTQFMPLGCLLDFCQKHKQLLTNCCLLNWSQQIASGMAYLEHMGIVHCDLAARNVLVQSPKQVKITDFGLAKILDKSQERFQSKGGKMPIKWLAIECIKNRLFSSKSDVWSYGVTLWEIFTFGDKPYSNIRAIDMLQYLENGQRLSQPAICSIDVYALMIRCWLVDPEGRPNFVELNEIFEKMCKNPNRYLMLQSPGEMDLASITSGMISSCGDDYNGKYSEKYDEFLQALISNCTTTSNENHSLLTSRTDYDFSYSLNNNNNNNNNNSNYNSEIMLHKGKRSNRRRIDKTLSIDTDYTSLAFEELKLSNKNPSNPTTSVNYINSNYQYLLNISPQLIEFEEYNNNSSIPIAEDGYLIPCNSLNETFVSEPSPDFNLESIYPQLQSNDIENSRIYSCDKTNPVNNVTNDESML